MKKRILIAVMMLSAVILGQETLVCASEFSDTAVTAQVGENHKLSLEEMKKSDGWKEISDEKEALQDGEICDYPSLRDGEPIRKVKTGEVFRRIGTLYDVWSCVNWVDEQNGEQTGYILTDVLEKKAENTGETADEDLSLEGMIGQSTDTGVFAEASRTEAKVAEIGEIVTAAEGTSLKPLGEYRVTHYCPCAICCGPWTDGITSTGVTAITNRTIAVDPRVIPYGCNIVINGQVYVAEDCGGAIKGKRIDIYVATHEEAMEKGVYYTDVFLVQ